MSQIQEGKIEVKDQTGKQYTLPSTLKTFSHDYYSTSHRGQGQTVDKAIIVATTKSFPAVNDKQFYVSTTRGRKFVAIYTNDKKGLKQQVSKSGNRELAVEKSKIDKSKSKTKTVSKNKDNAGIALIK